MKETLRKLYFATINAYLGEMKAEKEKDELVIIETYLDMVDNFHRNYGRDVVALGAISEEEYDLVSAKLDRITDWLWGKEANLIG